MDRIDVIQKIINKKKAKNYLEIGIFNGSCFLEIKAKNKIAVDPDIRIYKKKKIPAYIKNPSNFNNKYFEMPSDDFFKSKSDEYLENKFDVAFIDGLHTFEQSLQDVNNTLKILKEDGIIILHDCNPQDADEAFPTRVAKQGEKAWSGDVWKTIVALRSLNNDLNIFTLDCDCGLGIITKDTPEKMLPYKMEDIKNFTYDILENEREKILNLKNISYMDNFILSLK